MPGAALFSKPSGQAWARRVTNTKAPTARQLLGARAETVALELLQRAGLKLIARNLRYPVGELDLVMWHGTTLVFVEVRSRKSAAFGGAAASIGAAKKLRVANAAQRYLQTHHGNRLPACRFDVVVIDGSAAPEWMRDAFTV